MAEPSAAAQSTAHGGCQLPGQHAVFASARRYLSVSTSAAFGNGVAGARINNTVHCDTARSVVFAIVAGATASDRWPPVLPIEGARSSSDYDGRVNFAKYGTCFMIKGNHRVIP
jgi:hypothetical protein